MLKRILQAIFRKENFSQKKNTDSGTQYCNYWADEEINYSPAFTAQDFLSSNENEEKKEDNNNSSNSSLSSGGPGCGCGGGCIGGCGGGCF